MLKMNNYTMDEGEPSVMDHESSNLGRAHEMAKIMKRKLKESGAKTTNAFQVFPLLAFCWVMLC